MVSEDYDGVDSPWNLSNAVQVNEPKNLIWTRVCGNNKKTAPSFRYNLFPVHSPAIKE